jgi:hypothetical protein
MRRQVRPEILDGLPADHPAARANRRDLRRINALQGTPRWFAARLRRHLRPDDHVLEAGAGDGTLGRELARRVPGLAACRYTGLDRQTGPPAGWPAGWAWRREDLRHADLSPPPRVVLIGNLLHQFSAADLADLGARLRTVPIWLVCEPHRSRHALLGLALLRPLLRLHAVSWRDGRTSIRAGFGGGELPRLLGADHAGRHNRVTIDPRGVYRLVSVATEA